MDTTYIDGVCKVMHRNVDVRLDKHDEIFDDISIQLRTLDRSDAKHGERIDNLCKVITNQTKAIWTFIISMLLSLAGFFIWYVQNL